MLKSKYKIYLLLLCLTGCVSEYNAQLPSSDEELLVVTGDIIANTEAIFSLSKSIPLSEDMPEDYRNIYVRIAVVGSDGYRSDFGTALGDGKYQVSIGELQDDVSYGIEIEYDGEIYTSSPSTPMVSSEIDSVSWIQPEPEQALSIRVSTHGDPGKTQYYMWNYREDWEIRASYITTCYFDPDMNRIYEDSNYPTFYCWKKEISRNILIGSTEKLKEHLIINNKLLDVPVNEDRFTVLYSIQVQQRALSKEGYEYYLNVQQQNEEMGGIFTPQPSEIQGNISCISQPKRRTIGYVGVYKNISEKRIYIHPNEIKRPPLYSGCEEVSDSEMDEQGYSTYLTRYLAGYRPVGTGTHIDHWALRRCTECEANGGSKNKPSFWPNDHQ